MGSSLSVRSEEEQEGAKWPRHSDSKILVAGAEQPRLRLCGFLDGDGQHAHYVRIRPVDYAGLCGET